MMTLLTDVALATWIICVTATTFVVVPALALGRPGGRSLAEIRHGTSTRGAVACISVAALVVWLDARELRLQSPADYDCLANARALLAGGQWIPDPAASVAALISRLAAVDPMQALR